MKRARWILVAAVISAGPLLARTPILDESRSIVLTAAAVYAAMALALNVVMGYAKRLSLAHAALAGLGAFASGLSTARGLQVPFVLGVAAGAVAGGTAGALLGGASLRVRGMWLAFVTLAFAVAFDRSVFAYSAGLEVPRPRFGGFVLTRTGDYLGVAIALLLLLLLVDANLVRSASGRAIRAVAGDPIIAASRGIDERRALLRAFVISGAMAGVAGAMYGGLLRFIDADTFSYERLALPIVALVAIAGPGSRAAVMSAAAAYAVMPSLVGSLKGWQTIVVAAGVIAAVALRPGGLAGAVHAARASRRRDRDGSSLPRYADLGDVSPSSEPTALELADVCVVRGSERILDGVSLRVEAGSIVGIVGPNGAGKTTLLDAISGLAAIDGGSIKLGEHELSRIPARDRALLGITRTFEKAGLIPDLSVLENIALASDHAISYGTSSALCGLPRVRRDEFIAAKRAGEIVTASGLDSRAETRAQDLSYGQQRLAGLACAVASGASVLLLDEPSAGLSPEARDELLAFLGRMRRQRSVVLVEHDIELALAVCDAVWVLENGRVSPCSSRSDVPASLRAPDVVERA